MSEDLKYTVWRDEDAGTLYLVPDEHDLPSGGDMLRDLDGNPRSTNRSALAAFEAERSVVRAHLEGGLADAMDAARNAFARLRAFERGEANKEADDEYFRRLILAMLGAPEAPTDADAGALDAFMEHVGQADALPRQLEELFPKEDREAVFESVMSRLRAIAGRLDASVLEERDDPTGWVEVLYREFFADEIDRKKATRKAGIKKRVSQSIADGLRSRGITPSSDLRDDDSE